MDNLACFDALRDDVPVLRGSVLLRAATELRAMFPALVPRWGAHEVEVAVEDHITLKLSARTTGRRVAGKNNRMTITADLVVKWYDPKPEYYWNDKTSARMTNLGRVDLRPGWTDQQFLKAAEDCVSTDAFRAAVRHWRSLARLANALVSLKETDPATWTDWVGVADALDPNVTAAYKTPRYLDEDCVDRYWGFFQGWLCARGLPVPEALYTPAKVFAMLAPLAIAIRAVAEYQVQADSCAELAEQVATGVSREARELVAELQASADDSIFDI